MHLDLELQHRRIPRVATEYEIECGHFGALKMIDSSTDVAPPTTMGILLAVRPTAVHARGVRLPTPSSSLAGDFVGALSDVSPRMGLSLLSANFCMTDYLLHSRAFSSEVTPVALPFALSCLATNCCRALRPAPPRSPPQMALLSTGRVPGRTSSPCLTKLPPGGAPSPLV